MQALKWDACDVILITGDAYIDHPSFGAALVGRVLGAKGFKVGIISQPDWRSADAFKTLGRPKLFFGVTAGNMDSMINHYTADRKIRSDDAYTPGAQAGKRPDRAVTVYAQRAREAFPGTPIIIGSIEASLRRIAHYDYWSDTVRRSVLPDAKADLLIFGNAERALLDVAYLLAQGRAANEIRHLRGTGFMVKSDWLPEPNWQEVNETQFDPSQTPAPAAIQQNPYDVADTPDCAPAPTQTPLHFHPSKAKAAALRAQRARQVIRLPSFEQVKANPLYYAHASRIFHLESNPGNARALRQAHDQRDVWLNPPPIPLSSQEMDWVYSQPFSRAPHPSYGQTRIPAWEMIRFSVNIMRGCFGGCTFCSITEHEGRIVQSRSKNSILKEIEDIRDHMPDFRGHITDLGGPTANMFHLGCKDPNVEAACRKLSCVYPDICTNLNTNHAPLIELYKAARALPGVKRITIGSGVRYDLAIQSPAYIKELVTHHVSGLLKIAPEHTEAGPLSKMMKPGIGSYERFKQLFDQFSREAGKKQHLVPYFIAAHPGSTDEDMLNLALWLKRNQLQADQVQTFTPTPLAMATTMYHSRRNPLRKIAPQSEVVETARAGKQRKLHKALLRYHDPENAPIIREALKTMGRHDLIGNKPGCLVPFETHRPENNFKPRAPLSPQKPKRR